MNPTDSPTPAASAPQGRRKLISIITPCYNEEENVEALYEAVKAVFAGLPQYDYEHLFADNASADRTVEILRGIAERDRNVRVIVNARNFGQVRSPFHAALQTRGDAAIGLVCDFQDPPERIPDLIRAWEEGHEVVAMVKDSSEESKAMWLLRQVYYKTLSKVSDVQLVQNHSGYCLYDRRVIEFLRELPDHEPYVRGLISELGLKVKLLPYQQLQRKHGKSKNNFFTLYDFAMLGITSYAKAPLRLATMAGFLLGTVSFLISMAYLILKLLFWRRFEFGMAPLLIGLFFFSAVQLFFIGLIGEYVAALHTIALRRPRVVERERINFDE